MNDCLAIVCFIPLLQLVSKLENCTLFAKPIEMQVNF